MSDQNSQKSCPSFFLCVIIIGVGTVNILKLSKRVIIIFLYLLMVECAEANQSISDDKERIKMVFMQYIQKRW